VSCCVDDGCTSQGGVSWTGLSKALRDTNMVRARRIGTHSGIYKWEFCQLLQTAWMD
jgi:hypothetical protein